MNGTDGYALPRFPFSAGLARWLLPLAVGLVAGAASVGLSPRVATLIRNHPYFAVRRITVRGNRTIGRDAILNAAGLRAGMSIWDVAPESGATAIAALPRARRARIWREFPDRVVVAVTEREPQAIVVLKGLRYVDRTGRILGEVRPGEPLDFPFLTGVDASYRGGAGRRTLRRVLRLARLCERRACGGGVSELHLDREHGLVLVPRSFPVPVIVGWGRWKTKIERLERVLADWRGRAESLAAIDVTLRHAAVVRIKKSSCGGSKHTGGGLQI